MTRNIVLATFASVVLGLAMIGGAVYWQPQTGGLRASPEDRSRSWRRRREDPQDSPALHPEPPGCLNAHTGDALCEERRAQHGCSRWQGSPY